VPNVEARTLRGKETVKLLFREATATIQFNAIDMRSSTSGWTASRSRACPLTPAATGDGDAGQARQAPGNHTLTLDYTAKIESGPRGLFAQPFVKPDGGKDILLSTQFEATDARRMFPCWDEPAFRSTLRADHHHAGQVGSISNMPVAPRKVSGANATTTFARSPKMPSYLVELTSGDMASIGGKAGNTDINVWAVRGQEQYGKVALENARHILQDYNAYFDHAFPLPKLDLIAVPGGFQGAMENWGAITYNDQTLLVTPSSTIDNRQLVFSIEAHEMAHQWFGDLVTMGWWDDIWLNESFASWATAKETELRNPSWHVREQEDGGKEAAMRVDARTRFAPVHNPVDRRTGPRERRRRPDHLQQGPGRAAHAGSLHRSRHLPHRHPRLHEGPRSIRTPPAPTCGTRSARPAATTSARWRACGSTSRASPSSRPTPVRRLGRAHHHAVAAALPAVGQRSAHQHWNIPLRVRIGADGARAIAAVQKDGKRAPAGRCDQALSINANADGFFRTAYDAATLRTNAQQFRSLPPGDRIALLDDQWALVENGTQPLDSYLALVGALGDEPNERAWSQILGAGHGRTRGTRNARPQGLCRLRGRIAEARSPPPRLATPAPMRPPACSACAAASWAAWARGATAMSWPRRRSASPLRGRPQQHRAGRAGRMVLTIVAQNADAATFEQLHAIAKASEERDRGAPLLSAADARARSATGGAGGRDRPVAGDPGRRPTCCAWAGVRAERENPQLSWKTFTGNVDRLTAPNPGNRPNVLAKSTPGVYWNSVPLDQLSTWIKAHVEEGMTQTLENSMENARFKLSENGRLLQAANKITGASTQ
jgi:hypothetical protein